MIRTTLTTEQLQEQGLQKLRDPNLKYVIGVDEVGYGAWCGPCAVCACIVSAKWLDSRIKDSKQMSHQQRAAACRTILLAPTVRYHSIRIGSASDIDLTSITAVRDALVVWAVQDCLAQVPKGADFLVVMDGNKLPKHLHVPEAICFPKADSLVPAVSAASILAKEHRDNLMREMHKLYPWYGLDTGMGYGTAQHQKGLEEHGICLFHRKSYRPIKKYL